MRSWRATRTSRTAKERSWVVVNVDLRDSFEEILKSADE